MSAPVLFLDVDGVLNSKRHRGPRPDVWGMAGYHISELARVVKIADCQIVVSSAWRRGGIDQGSDFYESLADHVLGPRILARVIGATPLGETLWGSGAYDRGWEIEHWLEMHPDVSRFAIVDDDSDAGSRRPDRFVQTQFSDGLTREQADRLIELLVDP